MSLCIFLSTPSARRATPHSFVLVARRVFLSTPSARRATSTTMCWLRVLRTFLSTPSARRATSTTMCWLRVLRTFLSTPSARRATGRPTNLITRQQISIHALREEGDPFCPRQPPRQRGFLSTPSARRATSCRRCSHRPSSYFYPRPPRGGRLAVAPVLVDRQQISIHALREEGDSCSLVARSVPSIFLSTPSARRATGCALRFSPTEEISIHALREEGDLHPTQKPVELLEFLSTPSARRATDPVHALRLHRGDFYPRPPRGGRHRVP